MHTNPIPTSRRWRALCALGLATLLAIGCGGGVGAGGTGGTVPPLSFAQGPITGFGSIVVNGVHFDETAASVVDDDGRVLAAAVDLKLGSTVDVQAGAVSSNAATASAIHVHTDLVGPVTAIYDAVAGTVGVMGQPVKIIATTALDGFAGGAAGIAANSVAAVSSLYDPATGVYVATRIDPDADATSFATRGAIAALDASAHTFAIGTQTFDYGSLVPPVALANGTIVRVQVSITRTGAGHWVVTSFGSGTTVPPDGREGDLNGVIGTVIDATHFVVAGVTIDAGKATFSPAGAVAAAQERVEVQGTMVGGVLVATQVQVEATSDDDGGSGGGGGGGGGGGAEPIEIDGAILGPIDTVNQTFLMRGPTTVNYASATFVGGTAANLAQGRKIEMKGNLSADGTQVVATDIKFDH